MRIVIDALGATERSGGMRLHAEQIVTRWARGFPGDSLTVAAGPWATDRFRGHDVAVAEMANESPLHRALAQRVGVAWLAATRRADAVVSLSPYVTALSRRPTVCFEHDWRHIRRPQEFSRAHHLYRRSWVAAARRADLAVCISGKAALETLSLAPEANLVVVPNGYDHAATWTSPEPADHGRVVTFGHHNNKRPHLLIEAFGRLAHRGELPDAASLVVLGARGTDADRLHTLAQDLHVAERVELPGFVSDAEYQRIVSGSGLVALVSSDEGFGLPVAEAIALGRGALITSDSGMTSVFGDYPLVAEPTSDAIAHALRQWWARGTDRRPLIAAERVPGWRSWDLTVAQLREQVAHLVERHRR